MTTIIVTKRDHAGQPQLSYSGDWVSGSPGEGMICLRAVFQRSDIDAGYVIFGKGDVFTEWFFADRWYNIFQLNGAADGRLKGWYCNIARPALLSETHIYQDDLALDVFIAPDGTLLTLDQDEFDALPLREDERREAWAAVAALRALAQAGEPPFEPIRGLGGRAEPESPNIP